MVFIQCIMKFLYCERGKVSTEMVRQKNGCTLKMEDSYHANLAARR